MDALRRSALTWIEVASMTSASVTAVPTTSSMPATATPSGGSGARLRRQPEHVVAGWVRGRMRNGSPRDGPNGIRRPLEETRFAELSTETRTVLSALVGVRARRRRVSAGASSWPAWAWRLLSIVLGAATLGACIHAPHSGWTGWAAVFGARGLGGQLERHRPCAGPSGRCSAIAKPETDPAHFHPSRQS